MHPELLDSYLDSLKNCGVPGLDLIIRKDRRTLYRHMTGSEDARGTNHSLLLYMTATNRFFYLLNSKKKDYLHGIDCKDTTF